MTTILAIDTSTSICSVALNVDGDIAEKRTLAPRQHAQFSLQLIDQLLKQAGCKIRNLDAISIVQGPGSFTGLRIGMGIAQGLAFAAELPVIPVSSLAVIAMGAMESSEHENILVSIKARENEIYWGAYLKSLRGVQLLGQEQVCAPDAVELPENHREWHGYGDGWEYRDALINDSEINLCGITIDAVPSAKNLSILAQIKLNNGELMSPEEVIPVYLKEEMNYRR